jgi:3-oxoacyl-[acyl-carrier-protein] synthase III
VAFGILGIGSAFPPKVLTNADLEKMVETNDEWIRTRTGIQERHICDPETASSDLAAKAGQKALESAGLSPSDIDLIICCTFSPDTLIPSAACQVMVKLDIPDCAAFDLNAACSGFLYGMATARGLLANRVARRALVIGVDCVTRFTNWKDRNTCVLFGDGAGAVVLGQVENGRGIISESLLADGRLGGSLQIPAGGSRMPLSQDVLDNDMQFVQMAGSEVFKFAVRILPEVLLATLEKANMTVDDLDWIVPHQANIRIIESGVKRLKIDPKRVVVNEQRFGNTSAASVPLALDEAVRDGRIHRGHTVALVAFGGGLTWGASIFEY